MDDWTFREWCLVIGFLLAVWHIRDAFLRWTVRREDRRQLNRWLEERRRMLGERDRP